MPDDFYFFIVFFGGLCAAIWVGIILEQNHPAKKK